jgi:hypothetical protein
MVLMSAPFFFQRDSQFKGEIWYGGHQSRGFWRVACSKRIPFLGTRTMIGVSCSQRLEGGSLEGTLRWIKSPFLCRTPYKIVTLRGRYGNAGEKEERFVLGLEVLRDDRRTVFFPTFGNLWLLVWEMGIGLTGESSSHHRLSAEIWHHELLPGDLKLATRFFGGFLSVCPGRGTGFDLGRDALLHGLGKKQPAGQRCLALGGTLMRSLMGSLALAVEGKLGLLWPKEDITIAVQELGLGIRFMGNSPLAMQLNGPTFTKSLTEKGGQWRLGWYFRWGSQPRIL